MKVYKLCCDVYPKWIENVANKGYYFCNICRKEVNTEVLHHNVWNKDAPRYEIFYDPKHPEGLLYFRREKV